MNGVTVRNVEIGAGVPKICVPIVASSEEKIKEEVSSLLHTKADLVEWRVDLYEDVEDLEKVGTVLKWMREKLEHRPLLFTFRTVQEGGTKQIELEFYLELLRSAIRSKQIDLVDVELFTGEETVKRLIEEAHESGVKVIVSNHDFQKTPCQEELVSRIGKMWKLGADIPKIAVMPQSSSDVLTLLQVTETVTGKEAKGPVITMSMGRKGMISRLSGEFFGSAVTFASSTQSSAPGQMDVGDVHMILSLIHEYM